MPTSVQVEFSTCTCTNFCVCLFVEQHSKSKIRYYKGTPGVQPCVDLILADIPEGLPVPGISNPPTSIPTWNQETPEWLQPIFDFADNHLHDDGAIILFHPFRMTTKANILGYCVCFGFHVLKEWWGINRLHLTSPIHQGVTVSLFSNLIYS
jgi:hypothetical protein